MPAERRGGARQGPGQLGPRGLRRHPGAGRALRRGGEVLRREPARRARLPGQAPLQHPRPDRAGRVHDPWAGRAQDAVRPRPHERQGAQGLARPGRVDGLQRSPLQPLLVDPGRLPAHLRGQGLHRAVRRRQHRLRREVEAPPGPGSTRPPTGASGSAPTSTASAPRATRAPTPRTTARSPTRSPPSAGSRSTSRSVASASTTSTRTAWRTTASTSTGSRT